jgi:hypothetical protein
MTMLSRTWIAHASFRDAASAKRRALVSPRRWRSTTTSAARLRVPAEEQRTAEPRPEAVAPASAMSGALAATTI